MVYNTWLRGGWGWQKWCGWSSPNSRINNWDNCCEQPNNKRACRNLFGMFMETIACIISGLTWEATVAQVCTVNWDYRSRQQAAIHLSRSTTTTKKKGSFATSETMHIEGNESTNEKRGFFQKWYRERPHWAFLNSE